MSILAAGVIDWEHLTGQSKFFIEIVSVPIFIAIAGVLTNWTGVANQAKLAKCQPRAATNLGHVFGHAVITLENMTREVLAGTRRDRSMGVLEDVLRREIGSILGPVSSVVRAAVGAREFDATRAGAAGSLVVDGAPVLTLDGDFTKAQSGRIEKPCTAPLRALSPAEFTAMPYSAVEQDARLLYACGGFLGISVGAIHLLIFGP
jgi:hypothetical protein